MHSILGWLCCWSWKLRQGLWLQITKAEYNDFFKVTFSEFMDPSCHTHFSAEGTIEFTAMVFVPGMAPFQQEVSFLHAWCLQL